jgi:uncharacterized protein
MTGDDLRKDESRPGAAGDVGVDEAVQGRELGAGEFSLWLRCVLGGKRQGSGVSVPCGDCSGCCRSYQFIHIAPSEVRTLSRIPKALLFPAPGLPKGYVLMGYDAKGECPMWARDRCAIYDDRPQTCRDYDCRIFAATAIPLDEQGPQALIAQQVRRWHFDYPSAVDLAEARAVRAAGTFLHCHGDGLPLGTLPRHPIPLALLALEIHRIFLNGHTTKQGHARAPSRVDERKAVTARAPSRDDVLKSVARASATLGHDTSVRKPSRKRA